MEKLLVEKRKDPDSDLSDINVGDSNQQNQLFSAQMAMEEEASIAMKSSESQPQVIHFELSVEDIVSFDGPSTDSPNGAENPPSQGAKKKLTKPSKPTTAARIKDRIRQDKVDNDESARNFEDPVDSIRTDVDVGDGQSVMANVQTELSAKAIRKQLDKADLTQLYSKKTTRRGADTSSVEDVVILRPQNAAKCTYQRLVECQSIQNMIAIALNQLRNLLVEVYDRSASQQRIEVVMLIDDSCSMAVFEHHMYPTIALLIEVLRRLECKVAIGRFAGAKVNNLIKDFDTPFNMELGELILERITCSGKGTRPDVALRSFIDKIWPTTDGDRSSTHRLMLLLTDGLTNANQKEDYTNICRERNVHLNLLMLYDASRPSKISKESILLLKALKDARDANVSVRDVDIVTVGEDQRTNGLAITLADILRVEFKRIRDMAGDRIFKFNDRYRLYTPSPTISTKIAELDAALSSLDVDLNEITKQEASTTVTRLFKVSSADALLPNGHILDDLPSSTENEDSGSNDSARRETLQNYFSDYEQRINELRKHADSKMRFPEADGIWTRSEQLSAAIIDDLVQVLEDCVLPFNKFTRRKGDIHGSSLYIPGLMKAIATDFTYMKFMSNLSAGGKRQYGVVIAIDLSLSMLKFNAQCAMHSLVLLTSAMQRISVEYSIITFGENVRVIKPPQAEWDSAYAWMVLTQMRFDECASFDADAIYCGLDLLASVRGPKKMFVLTDGFGTSGLHLTKALRMANEQSVQVIGMGVGLDQFHVSRAYQTWLECALPKNLPDALRALFESEDGDSQSSAEKKLWQELNIRHGDDVSVADIIASHQNSYSQNEIAGMNKELENELKIQHSPGSDLSLDVCFCLDITGSMAPYFQIARSQIEGIVRAVTDPDGIVAQKCPGLKFNLRVAVVGYRDDVSGSNYAASTLQFTEDVDALCEFLGHENMKPSGGEDIPEDVTGAFKAALGLEWKSTSKTIVLITDAPGHGAELCGSGVVDRYPSSTGPKAHVDEMRTKKINLFFCEIREESTKKMKDYFQSFVKGADDDEWEFKSVSLVQPISSQPMSSAASVTPESIVFIMCLDESGSMSGEPFEQLRRAYANFLARRTADQGGDQDRIAVIMFGSSARFHGSSAEPVNIRSAPSSLDYKGEICN